MLPLGWLLLRAFNVAGFSLGPNPVEALLHALGLWGLRLLLLTLCVRPAAVLLRRPRLLRLRRMLGLFAFTYLLLHFLTWLVLDRGLDWGGIVALRRCCCWCRWPSPQPTGGCAVSAGAGTRCIAWCTWPRHWARCISCGW
jgi:hypothetical protein